MQKKQENFNKLWHDDNWVESNVVKAEEFDYSKHVRELKLFKEEHPKVMKKRIEEKNWKFDHDISVNSKTLKDKVKDFVSNKFGIELGYKNYTIVKR